MKRKAKLPMRSVAVANQKGGMGKTTIALHLAYYGVEAGLRVLCVDMQPHGNFTQALMKIRERVHGPIDDVSDRLCGSDLFTGSTSGKLPLPCLDSLDLVPADAALNDVAALPLDVIHEPRRALAELSAHYDLCIIDTAPVLGQPLYAALISADFVVCPCTMDDFALDGLELLFGNINLVREQGWNSGLVTLGLLANKVNKRRTVDMRALDDLRLALGSLVMEEVLYDRAATQYAKDRPVWRVQSGESQIHAAREMRAVCKKIVSQALQ